MRVSNNLRQTTNLCPFFTCSSSNSYLNKGSSRTSLTFEYVLFQNDICQKSINFLRRNYFPREYLIQAEILVFIPVQFFLYKDN